MIDLLNTGMQPREIRSAIDNKYAAQIDMATPTPYPPGDLTWNG